MVGSQQGTRTGVPVLAAARSPITCHRTSVALLYRTWLAGRAGAGVEGKRLAFLQGLAGLGALFAGEVLEVIKRRAARLGFRWRTRAAYPPWRRRHVPWRRPSLTATHDPVSTSREKPGLQRVLQVRGWWGGREGGA